LEYSSLSVRNMPLNDWPAVAVIDEIPPRSRGASATEAVSVVVNGPPGPETVTVMGKVPSSG
jgi:hypothetical protein